MTKTFTQNDVVRYIYEETTEAENKEIEQALICDARLQEMYKELDAVKKRLDHSLKQPSDSVIESIMNYSKSLNLPSKK